MCANWSPHPDSWEATEQKEAVCNSLMSQCVLKGSLYGELSGISHFSLTCIFISLINYLFHSFHYHAGSKKAKMCSCFCVKRDILGKIFLVKKIVE